MTLRYGSWLRSACEIPPAPASVIINGAAGAVKGMPGTSVYSASKAALRSFARTWLRIYLEDALTVSS